MYCVRCGEKADEKRKVCKACGMRLITPEALLKLLKKADAEKASAPEMSKKPPKDARKRVAPLLENPTQPKRRSIFDEDASDVSAKPEAKKKYAASEKKTRKPEKKLRADEKIISNPVVKLPPKKTAAKSEERSGRRGVAKEMFLIPERRESAKKGASIRRSSFSKGAKTSAVRKSGRQAKATEDEKRHKAKKSAAARAAHRKKALKTGEEGFVERHLRSIVSMALLFACVTVFLVWVFATEDGLKTMAASGIGTGRGYILLGDDCMEKGNYNRAVEFYYKALKDKTKYTAALKLSEAYRRTGDIERETSALMLLLDQFPWEEEPYRKITELYPDPRTRPESVKNAIGMYENSK